MPARKCALSYVCLLATLLVAGGRVSATMQPCLDNEPNFPSRRLAKRDANLEGICDAKQMH